MKKRLTSILMVLCLTLSLLSGMVFSVGAEALPCARELLSYPDARVFAVETQADLETMADLVNGGMRLEGYIFLQTADITLSGEFTPIGENHANAADPNFTNSFKGTYDGQKHTISNLIVNQPSVNGVGLFGSCVSATLKNIGIESGSVIGANRAGGIAGYADNCTVINCYNKADISIVSGVDGVGGIAGVARNSASFYGCFNLGAISSASMAAAGICGWGGTGNAITIHGCYNGGNISIVTTTGSDPRADVICRNRDRTDGDFSDSYYLSGVCDDQYNNLNAVKLDTENNAMMAYMMNRAQGFDSGAFTLNEEGELIFADDQHDRVVAVNQKIWRGGVLLSRGINYQLGQEAYTVPASYNGVEVLYAVFNGATYPVGAPIALDDSLIVELHLEGSYPSVREIESRPNESVYTVGSAEELAEMAALVNLGLSYAGKTVYVTDDLDFSAFETWTPIGTVTGSGGGTAYEGSVAFRGVFDGQYHHFKNINFTTSGDYQALFSYVEGGAIRNLVLEQGSISSDGRRNAVLCGLLRNSTVSNIENRVAVYSTNTGNSLNMGLLALTYASTIKSCVNYAEVGLKESASLQENGGISGYGFGNSSVIGCMVAGAVRGDSSDMISRSSTMTNCFYLPTHESAGSMTWERFLSGEAAWILNTQNGKTANAGVWSNGAEGPALDPDHAVYKLTAAPTDSYQELLEETDSYWRQGDVVEFDVPDGYTLDRAVLNGGDLPQGWTMPGEDTRVVLYLENKTFPIRYVLNGGTFLTEPPRTFTAGYAQVLPGSDALEREGFGFAGWYDNEALEGEPVTAIPAEQSYGATYYAAWTVPVEISTPEQLMAIATGDLAGSYIMTADIDLYEVTDYQPIGTPAAPFTGTFDGNGHIIMGLFIDSTDDYQGLFGVNAGTIRNVTMANDCWISGNNNVGGIAGSNIGTITDCVFQGTVESMSAKDTEYKLMSQNLAVWGSDSLKPYMVNRITTNSPDIICFQEGNPKWVNYLKNNLTGYTLLYKYRGYPTEDESVPLAFKTDRFELVESGHFWLNENPDVKEMGWDAACLRICTWAVLRNKENGEMIAAYSIHLDHVGTTARREGCNLVKSRIMGLQERYPGIMLFAAGDFNCGESSEAYNALTTDGMGDARYLAAETSTLNTHSSVMTDGWESSSSKIDFITTYAAAVKISKFQVLAETYNGQRPSDHNGLLATFSPVNGVRYGGITGYNTGTVRRAVADTKLYDGEIAGLLIGSNQGITEDLYYVPKANCTDIGEGNAADSYVTGEVTPALAYQLNQKAGYPAFTLKEGFYAATGEGDAIPVRLTVNGAVQYALSGASLTLDTTGYTDPVCAVNGVYMEGTVLTVPNTDAVITITENTACVDHDYSTCVPMDENAHRKICANNASHYVEEPHRFGTPVSVAADCENAGYTVVTCADCGYEKITAGQPSTGHSFGAWTYYSSTAHQRICAGDDSHVEYAPHAYSETYYPATCESYGHTRYTCVCGYYYDEIDSVKLGHDWSAPVGTDEQHHQYVCRRDPSHILSEEHTCTATPVNATCESEGGIKYTCTVCFYSYISVDTLPLGHQYGAWQPVDAFTHQAVCANDSHHIKTADHQMDSGVIVAPKCGEQGYTRYTCGDCGYYFDVDFTDALEHQWGAWIEDYPASETAQGQLHRSCALCGGTEYRVLPTGADTAVVASADLSEPGWLTMTVCLQNNPGLASLQLLLDYDPAKLQIESAEALERGDALSGLLFGTGLSGHLNDGAFKATWVGGENDTSDGTLFTLRFRVLEEGALRVGVRVLPDTAYNADCAAVTVYDQDLQADIHVHRYAWDEEKHSFVCSCGAELPATGDPDRDGYLTTADAVVALRYLNGWDVDIDLTAADFSGDGVVSIYDVVLILKLLSA